MLQFLSSDESRSRESRSNDPSLGATCGAATSRSAGGSALPPLSGPRHSRPTLNLPSGTLELRVRMQRMGPAETSVPGRPVVLEAGEDFEIHVECRAERSLFWAVDPALTVDPHLLSVITEERTLDNPFQGWVFCVRAEDLGHGVIDIALRTRESCQNISGLRIAFSVITARAVAV